MNTRYLKLGILFFLSYVAVLLYPISYLFSSLLTVTQHQVIIGGIVLLVTPIYIVGLKRFGFNIVRQTIKYSFFTGNPLRRVFSGTLIFMIIGFFNAVVLTIFTSMEPVPFTFWNPAVEGGVLIICLFSLLLHMAVIQDYKESLPSEEEISEAYDRAAEELKELDTDQVSQDE